MLLITKGAEPKTTGEIFEKFTELFIDEGLISNSFRSLIQAANEQKDSGFSFRQQEVYALADAVTELYRNMDDSLQFPAPAKPEIKEEEKDQPDKKEMVKQDLRGVACPMNFVRTKIALASLASGDLLEIYLDDGQPIVNVPGSVRAEGHEVLEETSLGEYWKVIIRKK